MTKERTFCIMYIYKERMYAIRSGGYDMNIYKRTNLFLALVLILVICSLGTMMFLSSHRTVYAQTSSKLRTKYFTSIQITSGDSLWSIAKDNITDEYRDLRHYIDEIKATNNLSSDMINEGKFLLIPYYADQPRQ